MKNLSYKVSKLLFVFLFIFRYNDSFCKIVAIGDSHSRSFEGLAHCRVHWVGPYTMHRIGRDGLNTLNFAEYDVHENDIVVTVFGEIDVRCHIIKQAVLQDKPVIEIIKILVDKHINTIIDNRNNYKNIICIVNAVIPPTDQINNPDFPIYGTLLERINATIELNNYLKKQCKQNNMLFFNPYKRFKLLDGQLDPAASDGNVHLGKHAQWLLQQQFQKFLKRLEGNI
jgi:hypothetical protein